MRVRRSLLAGFLVGSVHEVFLTKPASCSFLTEGTSVDRLSLPTALNVNSMDDWGLLLVELCSVESSRGSLRGKKSAGNFLLEGTLTSVLR